LSTASISLTPLFRSHLFTDLAYITFSKENAASSRRFVDRHEYHESSISNVCFETAAQLDRDVELKFVIDGMQVSIDIWKNEIENAKVYYKLLIELSHVQARNKILYQTTSQAIQKFTLTLNPTGAVPPPAAPGMPPAPMEADAWINNLCRYAETLQGRYAPFSYKYLFEQYRL
jgi:hypothetical protein